MKKILDNLSFIGDIMLSQRNGKPIVKLYQRGDTYFLLDIVAFTKFTEYYAYEISKENLTTFLEIEKNEYLLPSKNQLIYRIHFFDFEILEVLKYKKSFENSLSLCDDDFECYDINLIKKHLNLKTKENATKSN
jgi:hypothetical protein